LGVALLERSGIDPAPLLQSAGLSAVALREGKRVDVRCQIAFLEQLSRAVKDDWIGLTLAAGCDLRKLGLLYYVAASSHTLGEGLKRLERYARVGSEALALQVDRGKVCSIRTSYVGLERHRDRHQTEFLVLLAMRLCRHLAGRTFSPVAASFVHHRSENRRKANQAFGCDVEFDAYLDQVCFEAALLDAPLVGDDPFLNEVLVRVCEEALAVRRINASPFRTTVENTIIPLLPHGEASAVNVARLLGLSERTFARRLAAEGLSFGEILDELRRNLAVRYLAENLQAKEIAWLLGFQQPSSFSHACRRWTGKSPQEHKLGTLATAIPAEG
jgi:AraC-like DNA-binding protein